MDRYFLLPSGDGRDMTDEIETRLREYGVCILGAGVYCVSGVKMPDGSTLSGMGNATSVILSDSVESGAAIELGSFCSVRNLHISGSVEETAAPETLGERHGIRFMGDATDFNREKRQPKNSMISGCLITSFSGGGITLIDTGFAIDSSTVVSDCQIMRCGVGLNIFRFSEYHTFTGVNCSDNLYGCINNGGNNLFSACHFSGNKTGFLIDNRNGQSNNNSHGSVVGCTFNHSDKNNGIGIEILGARHGFVFSGCQLFFSKIVVENSYGISFSDFNCGKAEEIAVKGGGSVIFDNFVFKAMPKITVEENENVKFVNFSLKN